jgi:glutaconate CoA-transferase subunit A
MHPSGKALLRTVRPQMTLPEAVAEYVSSGQCLYLGNFAGQLFSVGHELIRAHVEELDVVMSSGGLLLDQLLGAGVVNCATIAHCWGAVGPAPAGQFRRMAEAGELDGRLRELSLGVLISSLTAAAWDVAWCPTSDLSGTGYVEEDWTMELLTTASLPTGRTPVAAALSPDIAFVHADLADDQGNCVIRGPLAETLVAAQAARQVVVVAEELVSRERIRHEMGVLPGVLVTALVEYPRAVWPDGAVGRYERDVATHERYAAATNNPDQFLQWLASLEEHCL